MNSTQQTPSAPSRAKRLGYRLFKTVAIVLLAFVLSLFLVQPFSISTATLISSQDASDYSITDFYNVVANGRSVRTLDPDLVIVDIGDYDRDQIADLIDIVNLCEPAVIGVDVTFVQPHDDDSHLLSAISMSPSVVLAAGVVPSAPDAKTFVVGEHSFFQDDIEDAGVGIVNLPTKRAKSTVREFPVVFHMADSTELPSFATAVAAAYRPASVTELRSRNKDTEIINYPSREFVVIPADRVADDPEQLMGKIVLIGAADDIADTHATPIDPMMSGVEIHAHAIATIVNGTYLNRLTDVQNWAIAIALCVLFVYLAVTLSGGYKGLVMRIIQVIILYLIVRCGYFFFVDHGVIIDFSYSFLMITFGLFAVDIWNGVNDLGGRAKKALKKSKNMKSILRKTAIVAVLVMSASTASAQYTLYSRSGDVTIKRGNETIEAVKGDKLKSNDAVIIGQGGVIEIYNPVTSTIYTSNTPGRFSVVKIVVDAQTNSKDHGSSVNNQISMGKGGKKKEGYVYLEKGNVTRALTVYDYSNELYRLDPEPIRKCIAEGCEFPFYISSDVMQSLGAMSFDFNNTGDSTVYVNVIKLVGGNPAMVEVSELGQAPGCYIVGPMQGISRRQLAGMDPNDRHYIVVSLCNFDVAELVGDLNGTSTEQSPSTDSPAFVSPL